MTTPDDPTTPAVPSVPPPPAGRPPLPPLRVTTPGGPLVPVPASVYPPTAEPAAEPAVEPAPTAPPVEATETEVAAAASSEPAAPAQESASQAVPETASAEHATAAEPMTEPLAPMAEPTELAHAAEALPATAALPGAEAALTPAEAMALPLDPEVVAAPVVEPAVLPVAVEPPMATQTVTTLTDSNPGEGLPPKPASRAPWIVAGLVLLALIAAALAYFLLSGSSASPAPVVPKGRPTHAPVIAPVPTASVPAPAHSVVPSSSATPVTPVASGPVVVPASPAPPASQAPTSGSVALNPAAPWPYRGNPILATQLDGLQASWASVHPGTTVTALFGYLNPGNNQRELTFVSPGQPARWGVATQTQTGQWNIVYDHELMQGTTALVAPIPGPSRVLLLAAPSTTQLQYAPDGKTFAAVTQLYPGAGLAPLSPTPAADAAKVFGASATQPVFVGPVPDPTG